MVVVVCSNTVVYIHTYVVKPSVVATVLHIALTAPAHCRIPAYSHPSNTDSL